jgi:hypothetical protein
VIGRIMHGADGSGDAGFEDQTAAYDNQSAIA